MEFDKVIRERYSVRKFSDKPAEREKIDALLEAAKLAPTAKNQQPVRIFVAQSEGALKIMNSVSPCVYGAGTVLVFCSDESECWVSPDGKSGGTMDASIVATQVMLAAANAGLGSCWVCLFDRQKLKAELGLADNLEPQCIMPIGYPAADAAPSERHGSRKPVSETVKFI